jgi:hypothetical protein
MKNILALFTALLFTFSAAAQKRIVDVGSFTELSLGISATLYLTQGDDEKVVVDCDDDDFEDIEFDYSSGKLTIKNKDKWSWSWSGGSDVDIYITMKNIDRLSVSGSGDIIGKNKINTDDLSLSISGSGDMDLDVSSEDVDVRISGSGSVLLNGESDKMDARISGSGKVKAEDMEVKVFKASISGSGTCYITASEEVNASISGSGTVYYSGNPDKVVSNSSGSGKVKKM